MYIEGMRYHVASIKDGYQRIKCHPLTLNIYLSCCALKEKSLKIKQLWYFGKGKRNNNLKITERIRV